MPEQSTASVENDGQEQPKTFTQEDVNRIVADRLKRAKADVPENIDELKAKAARFDELEEASKTELQKAQEEAQAAKSELESLKAAKAHADLVSSVAAKTGIPANLLHGETEEELERSASELSAYIEANKPGYPTDKGGAASAKPMNLQEQLKNATSAADRVRIRAAYNAQLR